MPHQFPVTAPTLLASLFIFRRRTSSGREAGPVARARQTLTSLLHEDLIGIFLLAAGISLFLLPIPLKQGGVSEYTSAQLIMPTIIGFLVIVAFIVWEVRFAKLPLLPLEVLTNRTMISALGGKNPLPLTAVAFSNMSNPHSKSPIFHRLYFSLNILLCLPHSTERYQHLQRHLYQYILKPRTPVDGSRLRHHLDPLQSRQVDSGLGSKCSSRRPRDPVCLSQPRDPAGRLNRIADLSRHGHGCRNPLPHRNAGYYLYEGSVAPTSFPTAPKIALSDLLPRL